MIMHLDMDAFFAAVEQMDHPAYAGKPLIVGGRERGVVSTASYEARKYGIHSAMPMATARRLCPDGIFVPGRYERYSRISRRIMDCLRDFSLCVQPASIDEAYLDMPDVVDPVERARAVKAAVREASGGLTCSVGLAPVKFLAKICSDLRKPDGIFVLPQREVESFLLKLDVRKIPGVGAKMAGSLQAFGIVKVAQLRELSLEFLEQRYGKAGISLYERARGIDSRRVRENPPPKSEGRERTFAADIRDREKLECCIWEQAEKISQRLQRQGLKGRTVTLKIKFSDFTQITRARTLEARIDSSADIALVGRAILAGTKLPRPVRLLGICVSGFEPRAEQLFLPGVTWHSWSRSLRKNRDG